MKVNKKTLLMLSLAFIFACIFAISVNAEVTTYDDAPARTIIQVSTDDVVVFDDGFSCPSAYVFLDQTALAGGSWGKPSFSKAFDFSYINGKTGKEYTFDNIVEVDIPQGVTSLGKYLAYGITTLKKVSIPDSVTSLGDCVFQKATNLEECTFEHGANTALTKIPTYAFTATSLKAISIPDSVTTIAGEAAFSGCSKLTAVHLPASLTTMQGGVQEKATFDGCSLMYFVKDPFTYDAIPEKPTVYRFPENFSTISNTCIFRNCSSLNEVLVFSESMLSVPNMYTFEKTGTRSIVFYGAVENISIGAWRDISVYLVNDNADIANVNSDLERASHTVSVKNVYLCKSNKTYKPVKDSGAATVQLVEQETPVVHLAEKTVDVNATCGVDAGKATYCYCGYEMSKEAIEGTALSHNYDYVNNEKAQFISIAYTNYSKNGVKTVTCANCGENGELVADALFTCSGYSAQENGTGGIAVGFRINAKAVTDYTSLTGKTLKYGVFAVSQSKLGDNSVFESDGTAADGVINAEIIKNEFSVFELKITGFTDGNKEYKLAMGAYVEVSDGTTTEYSYMQDETKGALSGNYYFASYNDIVAKN